MKEEKSVSLELALHFLSFTYYPLRQGTGLTCSFHFVVTHNNWSNNPTAFAFPQQAEQMTTRACVIQYTHCTKKTSEKKPNSVQNFFFFHFGELNRGWRSVGIFWDFFPLFFSTSACRPLGVAMLSEWGRLGHLLALWPAALERGGGPCGDGRARNMFRRVCLETGGPGQSAAREEDRAKHSWQTHTRPHAHTRTLPPASSIFLHKHFSFSSSYPPPIHFFPPCRGLKSQLNLAVLQQPDSISGPTGVTSSLITQMDCSRWILGNICQYGRNCILSRMQKLKWLQETIWHCILCRPVVVCSVLLDCYVLQHGPQETTFHSNVYILCTFVKT